MCILLVCLTYEKNLLRPVFKHKSVQAVVLPDSCYPTNVPYSFFSRWTISGYLWGSSSKWSVSAKHDCKKNAVIIVDLTTLLSGPPVTAGHRTRNSLSLFCPHGAVSPMGQSLIIREVSQSTLRRTPLDKRSARRRDLSLTTHTTHKSQISMQTGGIWSRNSQQVAGHRPTP